MGGYNVAIGDDGTTMYDTREEAERFVEMSNNRSIYIEPDTVI